MSSYVYCITNGKANGLCPLFEKWVNSKEVGQYILFELNGSHFMWVVVPCKLENLFEDIVIEEMLQKVIIITL